MWVQINGEKREVAEGLPLDSLIKTLNLTPERIATELNHRVVRRSEWSATVLREDDRIEIVHFVGGGAGFDT
ncbi:MAG: sulfur carrier protein ThiS [bacterium]